MVSRYSDGRDLQPNWTGPIAGNAQYPKDWCINCVWRNDAQRQHYAWVFSSTHPAGAQFTMCDASTQFLADTIDYRVLLKLAYIHDGQPVAIP